MFVRLRDADECGLRGGAAFENAQNANSRAQKKTREKELCIFV